MQILVALFLCLCTFVHASPTEAEPLVTVHGKVIDVTTKAPLPARVIIRDSNNKIIATFFEYFPGIFTALDGTFETQVHPGTYTFEATRGFDYIRAIQTVVIKAGENPEIVLALKPWVNMRARGWVNGDASAHLDSKRPWDANLLRLTHRISRAQGVDFIFANQGWAGYDEDRWDLAQSLGSDENFHLFFGAEFPKSRFGHSWWLGLDNTCRYLKASTDQGMHDFYRSKDENFDPAVYPYVRIPAFEIVSRFKLAKNAVAVHAHPTWWGWGGKYNTKAFMSFISAELIFDLLAGQIWDGMVIMGYQPDDYYLQALWFNILNLGYRMVPFSELDGGFTNLDPHYAGSVRTYYHIDGATTIENITDAARRGHVFVTSGPLVFATVDKKYQVGDIVPVNGQTHRLEIDAYCSGEFDDYISLVIVFRNGKIYKLWDHRNERLQHIHEVLDIIEKEKAWYVVKVYGSRTWGDLNQIDVLEVVKRAEADKRVVLPVKHSHDLAITSPFYFWPPGTEAPKVLISHVDLELVDDQGVRIPDCDVRILLVGREIARYHVKGGRLSFDMPVNAWVEVTLPGGIVVRRTLFADYPPFTDILYKIIKGKWTDERGLKGNISSGQVPWWVFQFEDCRRILTNPKWTIQTVPIERDQEWEVFEHLCGGSSFGVGILPLSVPAKIAIKGRCVDAETRVGLPACVVIRNEAGAIVANRYEKWNGFVTDLDGTFSVDLVPGKYTIDITHGFDYDRAHLELVITPDKAYDLLIALKPWVKTREKGWFNGEVRTELKSNREFDADLIRFIHKLGRAQGFDLSLAAQNWAGYGEDHWADAARLGSDSNFQLLFGAEMPRQRFGHTWWIGINNTCHYINQTQDSSYNKFVHSVSPRLTPERYPFTEIPSVEFVPRFKLLTKSVAVHAHPTAWTWQTSPGEQFISGISSDLVFDLLSGRLWDGMAVMSHDTNFYLNQKLWFSVLNLGYRMTPFCENESEFSKGMRGCENCRTYYYLNDLLSVPTLTEAARRGHTFVTSGPLIFATVDHKLQVGDIVTLDGKSHRMDIEAYASGATQDHITAVVIWRNGKVYKIWDHSSDKPRHVTHTIDIHETEKSWYVVKVHGSGDSSDPTQLEPIEEVSTKKGRLHHHQVAITSPFYFWPKGAHEPLPLTSHIKLSVRDYETGEPSRGALVRVLLLGKEIARYTASEGEVSFDMPVNAWLEISKNDITIRRGLFVDYRPYSKILYRLISGDWTSDKEFSDHLIPGRVPWEAFSFDESKQALENVDWTIFLTPNERDEQWHDFDNLCTGKLITEADPPPKKASQPITRLEGKVIDAETKEPLPARIVLRNSQGEALYSYYNQLPGFFTLVNGSFSVDVPPGDYTYDVTHGFDYNFSAGKTTVEASKAVQLTIELKPWVKLNELGWYNGEAHAHIVGRTEQDKPMIKGVHQIARAQGLDFLYAVQGWGGFSEDNWSIAKKLGSDKKFSLLFGAEIPKQRFGHTWWLGLDNICHLYDFSMDKGYSNYFRSTNTEFTEEQYPLIQMPSSEIVPRLREKKGALAIHAHPTSWWWQGGVGHQYITNVAVDIIPDLLSGQTWDGLVVMGYDHDHYSYQNLWFHLLNMGYRITPYAELDGGYDKHDPNYYGVMRTYYHIGGPFSVPGLVQAGRAGHTFVTSGPIVLATIDKKYQGGDVVPLDGATHLLEIEAYASGEFPDYISYVVVFRNGKIEHIWDDRAEKPRQVSHTLELKPDEKSWYVVKVYGSHTWDDPAQLDVMAVFEKAETDKTVTLPKHGSHDVAITSPFYFWPPDTQTPPGLISHVNLHVVDAYGNPIPKANVKVLVLGKQVAEYSLKDGAATFDMPVNAWVEVTTPEGVVVHRSLFVDYAPYNDLVYPLISGKWMDRPGIKENAASGHLPWWAFPIEEAKQALSKVTWTITAVPNTRDEQWPTLESMCSK